MKSCDCFKVTVQVVCVTFTFFRCKFNFCIYTRNHINCYFMSPYYDVRNEYKKQCVSCRCICLSLFMCMYMYMYIYVYITEKEKGRKRKRSNVSKAKDQSLSLFHLHHFFSYLFFFFFPKSAFLTLSELHMTRKNIITYREFMAVTVGLFT